MIVLDASAVIAFLEPDNALHAPATSLIVDLVAAGERELVVNPLTAAEVLAGFVPAGREEQAWRDLAEIGFKLRGLPDDPAAVVLVARMRMGTRLKMPDVVVLATALHLAAELVTFDAALSRAARRQGVGVLEPD